jgi:hypothetical protein
MPIESSGKEEAVDKPHRRKNAHFQKIMVGYDGSLAGLGFDFSCHWVLKGRRLGGRSGALLRLCRASIPLMISGCQKQPQQTSTDQQHLLEQSAAQSSTPTSAQKATTPVFVFSKTVSPSEAAPKANENLGKPGDQVHRLHSPQADEHAVVQGIARTKLEAALAGASKSASLPDDSASTLIDNLPKGFRDSCDQMMAGWGNTLEGSGKWTVRLLFSLPHQSGRTEAVLAFRCASAFPGLEQDYDERPVTIVLTPEAATLNLVPIQPECDSGCSHLYHLEFSQAFPAVGAQLVELRVYHTSDNPCCGGADEQSGSRMMILDMSRGKTGSCGG